MRGVWVVSFDDTPLEPLPEGWEWTTLYSCVDILDSQRSPINAKERAARIEGVPEAELYPYYGATGQVGWIDGFLFDEELLLLGEDGAPFFDPSKPVAYLIRGKGWVNNHAHVLRAKARITSNSYLLHWLNTFDFHGYITGTTRYKLNQGSMREIAIPLPPLNEQRRIVEAIEAQFTRLDAGIAALKRLQANLKRYKASVLKAACEGELVPQDPDDEPAVELLARILEERRARWEDEQLAKYEANGKQPPQGWQDKYKEPQPPDIDDLPELPEGWVWASVEDVCERIVDCLHSTPKFTEDGFICLDTNAIKPRQIVYERLRFVDEATFHERNRRMVPQADDVMFSREGALLGVGVRVPEDLEFCLGQRMMIFRLAEGMEPKYYEIVLNSLVFRNQYVGKIAGTASPHLNIADIRTLGIPLPPQNEQSEIVLKVDQMLSIVEAIEDVIEDNLKRAERLRQSILKEAFAGRLVPQDPSDEPASVLLERIWEEKEKQS
jgi:type I restriction enzyme S subunit